jgi:hypothetical protein
LAPSPPDISAEVISGDRKRKKKKEKEKGIKRTDKWKI